jgi:hypothetical protein
MLPARAADTAPSAEMLLYLAEFADDSGQPEDPVALTADRPAPNPAPTNRTEPVPDDASARTPPEPEADD